MGDPFIHGSASLSVSQKSDKSGKAFVHREEVCILFTSRKLRLADLGQITEVFELEAQSGAVLMKTKAAGSFGRDNCMVYSIKRGTRS